MEDEIETSVPYSKNLIKRELELYRSAVLVFHLFPEV